MKWNNHLEMPDEDHAFLSPSNYHWLNYDNDKLQTVYTNKMSKEEGTWLHDLASRCIQKRIKLAKSKNTLNMFVNDCIGFRMRSEQKLVYSINAFGTTDAISFDGKLLRIFDYKSGTTPASFKQLDIYAAYFCLEYNIDPYTIEIEERIYQNSEVFQSFPEGEYIRNVMNKTIESDNIVENLKIEVQKGM